MSRSTPFLVAPTIDECIKAGGEIGLPPLEAMKFFHHHESKGWKIGRERIKSLPSALQTWRFNWLERGGRIDSNGHESNGAPAKLTGIDKMIREKELERVLVRMKVLKDGVEAHALMRAPDRAEYQKLKARRDVLKK